MPEKIYLDYNATTPVPDGVIAKIDTTLRTAWGNPSSGHILGSRARDVLEEARSQVAALIGAKASQVIFTSGGTESNNLAIIGTAKKNAHRGKHLITTRIEHPSVLNPFIHLVEQGFEVDFIRPENNGTVSVETISKRLRPDTVLCSIMLANNETGAIQPVAEIGRICRDRGIVFHTDAAQAVGKMAVDVDELCVDLMTVAGHKLYAPKGIGALFVRDTAVLENILFGAGQEGGLRPGTEPVPLAVGLGEACRFLKDKIDALSREMARLKELFLLLLEDGDTGVTTFVPESKCLPNTLLAAFPGLDGNRILEETPMVLASTGAACHDRSVKVSHVLASMNIDEDLARGVIRFSLGIHTTEEEIRTAAALISRTIGRLRT